MDKILELFIENPEKEFHVRELARALKLSPTTVSNKLKKYTKDNILFLDRKLNHLFFKANSENPRYKLLKLQGNLLAIENSGLINYLEEQFHPHAIGLFGSFAKAENIPSSDIDLFIISSSKKELNLEKFEKYLKHKIQLFIFSNENIQKMKDKNKELLNNMANGIIIRGYFELFK